MACSGSRFCGTSGPPPILEIGFSFVGNDTGLPAPPPGYALLASSTFGLVFGFKGVAGPLLCGGGSSRLGVSSPLPINPRPGPGRGLGPFIGEGPGNADGLGTGPFGGPFIPGRGLDCKDA